MERDDELMPLAQALHILADVHTRDDDRTGFVVMHGASPEYGSRYSWSQHLMAWASVRHAVGKAAFPPTPSASTSPEA